MTHDSSTLPARSLTPKPNKCLILGPAAEALRLVIVFFLVQDIWNVGISSKNDQSFSQLVTIIMAENECLLAVSDRKPSLFRGSHWQSLSLSFSLSRSICTLIKSIGGQHIALSLSLSLNVSPDGKIRGPLLRLDRLARSGGSDLRRHSIVRRTLFTP